MNQPLDRKTAEQMIAALHTINNIENNPDYVKQPDDDIQLKGLKEFLSNSFIRHSSEFIGAWVALASEYIPLVNGFAALQRRVSQMNQYQESNAKQQQPIATAEVEPPTKSNIIVPKNFVR